MSASTFFLSWFRLTAAVFLFSFVFVCCAQAQPSSKDKIEALKAAFINKNIDFTAAEAQAFWPLYNDFQAKREALKKELSLSRTSIATINASSEKDVAALLDGDFVLRQKELDLQKDFHKKMLLLLSVKKVALYYKSEEEFKKALLNQLKDK